MNENIAKRRTNPLNRSYIHSLLVLFGLFPFALHAQDMSFSTDFDGVGNGSSISVSSFESHSDWGESTTSDEGQSSTSEDGNSDGFSAPMLTYLRDTHEEQLRQARERAEEERLREEMERVRRLNDLNQVQALLEKLEQLENDEPNVRKRLAYTQKVLELTKQFQQSYAEYMSLLPSYRQRLASSIQHIVVPPPPHPLHYHRILIWGMFSTPEEAHQAALKGIRDPFTGQPFDDVFAFGTKNNSSETVRVMLDHLLSTFEKLSPETTEQLGRLDGAMADEVVCHSNGATIVDALLESGRLNASQVRILGGDTSLFELNYLGGLASEKNLQELSVYVIRGDPVPMLDGGWEIIDLMRQIGHPLESFEGKISEPIYHILGLAETPRFNPAVPVQVHMLSFPPDVHVLDKHVYQTYDRAITGWRLSGCLTADGAINQRCMIY